MRILIIEGNKRLQGVLYEGFSEIGYRTDDVENLADAEYLTNIRSYDLVIYDTDIKQTGNPLLFFNAIRANSSSASIIAISNDSSVANEIATLKAGADDFLGKPFDFDLLVARAEARMRIGATDNLKIEDIEIFPHEERILYKKEEITLHGKPFEVLHHLARYADQIISKEQLLDAIWEEPELVTPNVVEVAINQIRTAIDRPHEIDTIETIRRRGYRFCYPQKL